MGWTFKTYYKIQLNQFNICICVTFLAKNTPVFLYVLYISLVPLPSAKKTGF